MRERSRFLRKNQTVAEIKFWNIVRKRQFHGFRFHRQYVLHGYILDFVCFQKRLVIEFDGQKHIENKDYDDIRDAYLKAGGFTVLRFWNEDLLQKTEYVLSIINQKLIELPDTPRYCKKALSPSSHVWERGARQRGCGEKCAGENHATTRLWGKMHGRESRTARFACSG